MTKITIQEKFRAAAKYFESEYKKDFGRGFQAKVAKKSGVRSSYLNEILKGKKDGPEEVRRKLVDGIASICDKAEFFTYEKFLELGECILSTKSETGWKYRELYPYLSGDIRKGLQKIENGVSELANDPKIQFHLGLYCLLDRATPDSRREICSKYNIDTKTLGLFLRGDICLLFSSQQVSQISSEFHLSYQDVLSLGDWIICGNFMSTWQSEYIPIASQSSKGNYHLIEENTTNPHLSFQTRDIFETYRNRDKNMMLITEWINLQEDPSEYWIFLKMLFRREDPDFRDWLKKLDKKM